MAWKWPAEHNVDSKDYHPRIGGGQEVVDGDGRTGSYNLAKAGSPSTGIRFWSHPGYGVGTNGQSNADDYIDFIFTFEDANTWCSGYRQSGYHHSSYYSTHTKDIEIFTGDSNFGPWTEVATDSHIRYGNGNSARFSSQTTTEWTPAAPSKYLKVRTLTNHGETGWGGALSVQFLQLKFAVGSD